MLQFSVQGNHLHLLVEATNNVDLGRVMKGLSVRIAKGLNRMMGRRGRVIGDRYHAHVLRTPSEVRRAVHYIRNNFRKHHGQGGAKVGADWPAGWVDRYSSDSATLAGRLPKGQSWLLRVGVMRGRGRWERGGTELGEPTEAVDLPGWG